MPGTEADTCLYVSKQLRTTGQVSDLDKVLNRAQQLLKIEKQKKLAAIKAKEEPSEGEALYKRADHSPITRCPAT